MEEQIAGLLFGSDYEVALVEKSLRKEEKYPFLIPPKALEIKENLKIFGYHGDNTHPIYILNGDTRWYMDGALFETDLLPTDSADEMYTSMLISKESIARFAATFGYRVWSRPVARFDKKYLSMGEEIAQACIAGCSPDHDAIEPNYVSEVRDLSGWDWRGLGAHLHMSICPETFGVILHERRKTIVRLLAITVGNMGIVTSKSVEMERIRRAEFGAAGRYRFPVYPGDNRHGIEYRSLSSEWTNSLESVEAIFEAAYFALASFLYDTNGSRYIIKRYLKQTTKNVAEVNVDSARSILRELNLL